jgi:DNA repair protein RadD
MQLRPYQEDAARRVIEYAVAHRRNRLLLVVPPRGGKTHIAATVVYAMAHAHGRRALWLAHRRELVSHARDHLIECGIPGDMIGTVMAGDKRAAPGAPIQVASVETLSRRAKPPADLVVTDEAHRDASEGRRKLRALYPEAFRLGLTGTPCRTDGRGLREDFDEMLCISSPSELIANGHLSAPRVFTVPPEFLPDTKGIRLRGGDFDQEALERAANRRMLVGSIVEHWQRHAEGRRTFAFPVSIKHSLHIVQRFREAGVGAEHVDGDTPIRKREVSSPRSPRGMFGWSPRVGCSRRGRTCPR